MFSHFHSVVLRGIDDLRGSGVILFSVIQIDHGSGSGMLIAVSIVGLVDVLGVEFGGVNMEFRLGLLGLLGLRFFLIKVGIVVLDFVLGLIVLGNIVRVVDQES